jgi:hypothetical protein
LYGGLDCAADWAWVGTTTKTSLSGPADTIPLRLGSGASGARVLDFDVRAADAVVAGGSSIAVLVEGASAELLRCSVTAGNGAAGADGSTPSGVGPEQ